jgi:hypothetical protein
MRTKERWMKLRSHLMLSLYLIYPRFSKSTRRILVRQSQWIQHNQNNKSQYRSSKCMKRCKICRNLIVHKIYPILSARSRSQRTLQKFKPTLFISLTTPMAPSHLQPSSHLKPHLHLPPTSPKRTPSVTSRPSRKA